MELLKLSVVCGVFICIAGCMHVETYDEATTPTPAIMEQDLTLTAPDGRDIPLRIFAPGNGCEVCTLVFFSHGAALTHEGYTPIIHEWAKNGYVIAAPLHVDSVLHPARESYSGFDWIRTRVEDYEVISSALLRDGVDIEGVELSGKLIAAGHSFGGLTAQIAGGAKLDPSVGVAIGDDALSPLGIIALSPPGPIENYISDDGWSKINRPMLVVTGTADIIPNFTPEWELHKASYEAAAEGSAYLLVFDDIDHFFNGAFGKVTPEGFTSNDETAVLNRIALDFIRAIEEGKLPSSSEWRARSTESLQATSR